LDGWESCPIVNVGPESEAGHANPRDDLCIKPGHLVHVDLGVRLEGFCSDLQRMWYVRRTGEAVPPEDVRRAFDTVVRAIEAGAQNLWPGVLGYETHDPKAYVRHDKQGQFYTRPSYVGRLRLQKDSFPGVCLDLSAKWRWPQSPKRPWWIEVARLGPRLEADS
jgi:Xaa-Pro aminopeptidase